MSDDNKNKATDGAFTFFDKVVFAFVLTIVAYVFGSAAVVVLSVV